VALGRGGVSYEQGNPVAQTETPRGVFFFFFFTLVTGPRRSLRLKLSDTRVYEPQTRARLGTTAHFCEVVVLKLSAVPARRRRVWWRRCPASSSLLPSSLELSDTKVYEP